MDFDSSRILSGTNHYGFPGHMMKSTADAASFAQKNEMLFLSSETHDLPFDPQYQQKLSEGAFVLLNSCVSIGQGHE